MQTKRGFTLLELLVALFIFTILSLMMTAALHSVIQDQASTEKNAERLRRLQIALLMFSRDIEQATNRPIINAVSSHEAALMGSAHALIFTHAGGASTDDMAGVSSVLERTKFQWQDNAFYRITWSVLDQAPTSKPHSRKLLENVTEMTFEYLDKDNQMHAHWPTESQGEQPIPKAIKLTLTIANWGTVTQFYIIPAQVQHAQAANN